MYGLCTIGVYGGMIVPSMSRLLGYKFIEGRGDILVVNRFCCALFLPPATFQPLGMNEAEADDELDGDHTPRRFKPATHRAHIRAGFEETLAKRRSAANLHTPSKPPG